MNAAFDRDVWAILGMPLDNVTLDEAAHIIERAVETRTRLSFVTPNVNWMVRALKDPSAMRQIVNADLSLADGVPVVWLAKQLGMPLQERVAGADLFRDCARTIPTPCRLYVSFSLVDETARRKVPIKRCSRKMGAWSPLDGSIPDMGMLKA